MTALILLGSVAPLLGGASSEDVMLRNGHADDESKELFAFGNSQGPRAPRIGIDIHPDAGGFVGPTDPPEGASAFADVTYAPLTGYFHAVKLQAIWTTSLATKADGSDVIPGSPNPPTHYTIYPATRMMAQEFVSEFLGLPWVPAGKK